MTVTRFPYSPAMQAELAPHTAAISTFRASLSALHSQFPDSSVLAACDVDDRTCYRWLKARQFNQTAALTNLSNALSYRHNHQLDTILQRPFPLALSLRPALQAYWYGYDKQGNPVYIERFGLADGEAAAAMCSGEERVQYHHYISEYVQQVLLVDASHRAGYLVDQMTSVFDMTNFSRNVITKANYAYVSSCITINSLLYPELMASTVIVNAPFVFSMGWSMVKGAIDVRTREKITITKGVSADKIGAVIDMAGLPTWLGGQQKDSKEVEKFEQFVRERVAEGGASPTSIGSTSSSSSSISERRGSDSVGEMERQIEVTRQQLQRSLSQEVILTA